MRDFYDFSNGERGKYAGKVETKNITVKLVRAPRHPKPVGPHPRKPIEKKY